MLCGGYFFGKLPDFYNMLNLPENCHCGKKMHLSPSQVLLLKVLGNSWGEYKDVQIAGGKRYRVPTYYIILHGIKARTLPDEGFEEIAA